MTGPFDGDTEPPHPLGGAGEAELQAEAGTPLVDGEPAVPRTRAQRKRAQSARVRHRRRVVAVVGGVVVVVILAFVLWYQLESHALGPEGRQVVISVHQGEGSNSVVDALSQAHVIGSSLAFRISDFIHGAPNPVPGSYALHENQSFSEVRAVLAAGPNIFPVDVRPGFTLSEVAQPGGRHSRARPGWLRQRGQQRDGAFGVLAARFEQPRRHAGDGELPGPPGRE